MVAVYAPGIDLVVVNYQTSVDLGHFLQSAQRHPPEAPFSLTVGNVDPFDQDRLVATTHRLAMDHTYCEWDENVGYATAVNYCASLGDREVIGIFNADTRLTEGVVSQCHNALLSDESWAVIGPRQVDDTGRITHAGIFGTEAHRQERGFHHRNSDQYADIRDDAISVSGSAYFIKRHVWDELQSCPTYQQSYPEAFGAFLPTQHYFEETFCSYHARAHGYRVVYYGAATMIHQWHRSHPQGGPMDRQVGIAREMFREACDAHGIEHE